MDWVEAQCDRLRSKLQHVIDGGATYPRQPGVRKGIEVPWAWACRSIIETVARYPSGLTEAVILAELELLWRRDVRGAFVPGKLRAYLDAQYAPLSDVIQASIIRHTDQLVIIAEDHSGSVAAAAGGQSTVTTGMYLHQNFKSCLHFLQQAGHDLLSPGRRVRLTGCRMLTGATIGAGVRKSQDAAGSTLLLTEYLAFVLDHRKSDDVKLATVAFGTTPVRETLNENSNQQPFFVLCKVVEIRRSRQHHQDRAAGPARKKRLTVQTIVLECAGSRSREDGGGGMSEAGDGGAGNGPEAEREIVLLHLWDEQMCLASLFARGDGLAIYWPWVVEESSESAARRSVGTSQQHLASLDSQVFAVEGLTPRLTGWHYEYGSATALFVLPRESRGPLFAAANGRDAFGSSTAVNSHVRQREAFSDAAAGLVNASEVPVDENGVRDLLQYPRRLSVADLLPNMTNVSFYGQVVSVGVPTAALPAVLLGRQATASASRGSLSQPQSKQLLQQPVGDADGVAVVEVVMRDAGGEARVLCFGKEATSDALGCRPGHFVLACGLRTLAPAFPPLVSYPGDNVVIICGEPGKLSEGVFVGGGRPGGHAGGYCGVGGFSRILNASRLEGLLHCPFMSRHALLCSQKRGAGPIATFSCKVAVTWARWAFDGDGLWVVHRLCRARLPCHYEALGASYVDSAKTTGRKRARGMREPGGVRSSSTQETPVTCPLCKSPVRLACPDEAELAYAPLLVILDDGSRCIVAECLDEVVTTALGGIHANVFLHMSEDERRATLVSLIGRELRCVVGKNGSGADWNKSMNVGGSYPSGEEVEGQDAGNWCSSGAEYRVELIALANPAADLAHLLR